MPRRRRDPVAEATALAGKVHGADGRRSVAKLVIHVEHLDQLARAVAHDQPEVLAAVEQRYVEAVAELSGAAARRGLTPDRPRELLARWVAEAVAPRTIHELQGFVEQFWSGPTLPYEAVLEELPRVQHLRHIHAVACATAIWQADPSWPDAPARHALASVSELWDERRVSAATRPA